MTERTIVLDDEDAALLDRLVETGRYQDAAEAIHESLKLSDLMRGSDALRVAAFEAAARVGLDDVAAGRVARFESAEALSTHFAARRRAIQGEREG